MKQKHDSLFSVALFFYIYEIYFLKINLKNTPPREFVVEYFSPGFGDEGD